jgi:hypothetical protein
MPLPETPLQKSLELCMNSKLKNAAVLYNYHGQIKKKYLLQQKLQNK